MYLPINNTYRFPAYSAGAGDNPRGAPAPTGADESGAGVGAASPSDGIPPSTPTPGLPAGSGKVIALPIGSGDCTMTCGRPSSDSGGRTPPRRKRGVGRGLRRSAGGCGGSGSSVLLGSHERNVRWSRASAACVAVVVVVIAAGAGLERPLGVATTPVPVPEPVPVLVLVLVLVVALSGTGLHGSSGRRDGKNRRGGTLVVFGVARGDVSDAAVPVVCVAESSASVSPLATTLLPSRPNERRRDVKSVKSTVRERAGRRRMDG